MPTALPPLAARITGLARGCALALATVAPACAMATGALENPAQGAPVSGIGVISGWHCTAARVEIEIDGAPPAIAALGTDRADTAALCGRRNTGFGLLLNWGLLPAGPHSVRALADGVEFGRSAVTVTGLGGEFLTGRSASTTVTDFPSAGRSTILEWRTEMQGFVAREVVDGAPGLNGRWNGANLEKRSNCASAQNNGTRGTYAQYDINIEQGVMGIIETGVTGLTCNYFGPFQQVGGARTATGAYTCSDGKTGDYVARGFLVMPTEMQIRLDIKLRGSETCTIDSILGGSRF